MSGVGRLGAALLLALALGVMPVRMAAASDDGPILVFAASSTTNVIQTLADAFSAQGNGEVITVFDATSRAARQIAQGAPAHVLVSANRDWADWVIACGPGEDMSRVTIARNRLVVIEPQGSSPPAPESVGFDAYNPAFTARRFAIADPTGVPAGLYARQALEAIGVWEDLSPRLLTGDNVRTVLGWVAAGAAQAGIVYATDAAISDVVQIVTAVPRDRHDPIIYEALLMADAPPRAQRFLEFLVTSQAQEAFTDLGFEAAGTAVSGTASDPERAPAMCG